MKIKSILVFGVAAILASGTAMAQQGMGHEGMEQGGMQQEGMQQEGMQQEGMRQQRSADQVRQIQRKLNEQGYSAGNVDGKWGPKTKQALRNFQEAQGLETTGEINQETLSALGIKGERGVAGQQQKRGTMQQDEESMQQPEESMQQSEEQAQ